MFNKVARFVIILYFIFVQSVWCMTTSNSNENEEESLGTSYRNKIKKQEDEQEAIETFSENTLEDWMIETSQATQQKNKRLAGQGYTTLINAFSEIDKLLLSLVLIPLAQAQDDTSDEEKLRSNLIQSILPQIFLVGVVSGLAAPIFKDLIYEGASKIFSFRFRTLFENLDTWRLTSWVHELPRWFYLVVRGECDTGDIPVELPKERSWFSFAWIYEKTTSHPASVELRHSVKKLGFKPYIVKTIQVIDKELKEADGWERTILKDRDGWFSGFSYESSLCTLHMRGGSLEETFEEMTSISDDEEEVSIEKRYTTWKHFFQPFEENDVNLLPSKVYELLQALVLKDDSIEGDDVNGISMFSINQGKTFYLVYDKGLLIIALQKRHYPFSPNSYTAEELFDLYQGYMNDPKAYLKLAHYIDEAGKTKDEISKEYLEEAVNLFKKASSFHKAEKVAAKVKNKMRRLERPTLEQTKEQGSTSGSSSVTKSADQDKGKAIKPSKNRKKKDKRRKKATADKNQKEKIEGAIVNNNQDEPIELVIDKP